jgi:PAS domain S-box-containing protein
VAPADDGAQGVSPAALPGLLATLPSGLVVVDEQVRITHVSEQVAASNGLSVAEHLGRPMQEVCGSLGDVALPIVRGVLQTGKAVQGVRLDGWNAGSPPQLRHWSCSYHPLREGGSDHVSGVVIVAEDRTDELTASGAPRQSETLVRRVLDSLFAFVGVLLPDGTLIEANRAPLEAGGLTLDDVRGRPFWDCPWWSHDPTLQQWLKEAIAAANRGETVRADVTVRMAGDTRMTIDFMLAPLRDERGVITHLIPSANDISERLRQEQSAHQSEAMFRAVVENAPDGMVMVDTAGRIVMVNRAMERLFGWQRADLIGQRIEVLIPAEVRHSHVGLRESFMGDSQRAHAGQRHDMGQRLRRVLHGQRLDGSQFPVEVSLNTVRTEAQVHVLATVVDITERQAAHAALAQALAEKTALLQEVHHRVKNNLQVISSLLSLQLRKAGESAREALTESQHRVKVMALIHQMLYEQGDFSRVPLASYLRKLVALLRDSAASNRVALVLELNAAADRVSLGLQHAVPCGLLVNELVTNALKHAYPAPQTGVVRVSLMAEPGGRARVLVADEGVGLPPDMVIGEGDSLGFQLIPVLAQQMGARLQWRREAGTVFEMCFDTEGHDLPTQGE